MNMTVPVAQTAQATTNEDWWRGGVIYQIYPRSYQDSNGDGVGDLAGIIHRLPHIASLGVDAIWISPFFRSPMLDFGYDVSNYRDVDPLFGSLGDFDALIARAHELGLKVMIDLVLSHSSDQHEWFQESRQSRDNAKSDWFVWADAKPDGTPPNNWLSIFGGSAWEWDGKREQYYLHNFLKEQPDLNLHNMDVQDALLDVVRYWLERGVDGFRLDTINFYFADKELRDNPALPPEERNDSIAPSVNPYNWQNHLYDKNQPENLAFLKRFRALCDEYPGITSVGEVGDAQYGMQIQADYTSGGDKVHMCYAFDFLSPTQPTGKYVSEVLNKFETVATDGWACWAFSNHDVVRHASRWNLGPDAQRVYAALLMSLRGSVCLYQGEELGLTEAYVSYEELQDPYGIRFWPEFKGRDGCRTPIPWSNDGPTGGFTDARPWLPVAMEHLSKSVATQDSEENSTLNFYRQMLAFRKAHPALISGRFEMVHAGSDLLSFKRIEEGGETVFCAFNLSNTAQPIDLPPGEWRQDLAAPFAVRVQENSVLLPPYQAFFAQAAQS
ncbi:alpha-amylase family glycosyl hydrolase [Pontivivens insulae]|uniref:Oligo-1,6-glucosidase 1 n=1 Tax=Pontivivens insulae TaxID=1639689 RepID=A0A2R8A6H0_9RHOB|nr:alpha-amylase family glycosyl hydrolase [Pontivivens insulae]RED17944.1 alpha-glucosidase [Pontivivens insulae]SPF27833.1 Oligo-1,6-glucosidase 1 [Pontivivens insulae]